MSRPWFYRVLETPWVYNLAQAVLAPGARRLEKRLFARFDEGRKELGLDFGCGPRLTSPFDVERVVGVDVNPHYVRQYTGGWIDEDPEAWRDTKRTRFGYVCGDTRLPFADGTFDQARCLRVLHHLPPATATWAIREMARCLKPGGRILLMDMVHSVLWRRPLAWTLSHLDRGEHVRTEQEFLELVHAACPGPWTAHRRTISYLGVEAMVLTWRKGSLASNRKQRGSTLIK
jgi:SAM-dependent methyltransferase